MRFVGRASELSRLRDAAEQARGGACRIVLVTGDAGVGKTRLVDEFASSLGGFRCVRAGGVDADDAPPLWPWRQVLVAADREPPAAGDWGFAVRAAYAHALVEATAAGPLLVVFDDAHRADAASRALLRELADVPPAAPLLVVAAFRDADTADPPTGPAVVPLELPGLAVGETAALVADLTGGPLADPVLTQLHRRTDGNPGLIGEVAGQFAAADPLAAELGPLPVVWPRRVLAAAHGELAGLTEATRRALAAASVIGREFDLAILEAVADVDVVAALDEAVRRRVVRPVSREVYRFARSLDREVLYDGLGVRDRARVHDAVATALVDFAAPGSERGPTVAELAYHLMNAAVLGGADRLDNAIAYTVAAGAVATQQGRYADAVTYHEAALHLAARGGWPAAARGRLMVGAAVARLANGDLAGGREGLAAAARLGRREADRGLLAAAALGYGPRAGSGVTAPPPDPDLVALLREALVDDSLDPSTAARVHARLAWEVDESAPHLAAASSLAEASGDPRALAEARLAALASGDHFDARPAVDAALALGDRVLEARARLAVAAERLGAGDVSTAVAELTAVAGLGGPPFARWYAALASAHRSLLAGRVDEALASADAAREVGSTVSPEGAALAHAVQVASVHLARGVVADLAPPLAALDRLGQRPAWFAALAGLVAAADGRHEVASALLAEAPESSAPWTTALFGELAVVVSDVEAARRLAAALLPHVDGWVVAGPAVAGLGPVGLTLARLHQIAGDPSATTAALDRASSVVGTTVWLPHVLLERARLLADRDADAARREAKAARQAAAERGLAGVVDRADEFLSGLEGRSAFGLTRREREILALAVTGLSAKDIAAQLYVGERTVETHLANIYRKLNVRTRVELIARFGPST